MIIAGTIGIGSLVASAVVLAITTVTGLATMKDRKKEKEELAESIIPNWAKDKLNEEQKQENQSGTETPKTETAETPKTETTETPKTETAETPKTETAETPKTETAETPKQNIESPLLGNQEVITGEYKPFTGTLGTVDLDFSGFLEKELPLTNNIPSLTFERTQDGGIIPKYNNNQEKETLPNIPNIEDKTNENVETTIKPTMTLEDWIKYAEQERNARWEREDNIRKETQEREDTAYQRAVADMKKAGLNVNLFGVNPAESGGGITQASGIDMSTITNQMDIDLEKLQQIIDNAFEGKENEKDRFNEIFSNIIQTLVMGLVLKR